MEILRSAPNLKKSENEANELIQLAKRQLEVLKPALKQLYELVTKTDPDIIVFSDKGARLFARPFKSFLKSKGFDKDFRFFNDHEIKGIYLTVSDPEDRQEQYEDVFNYGSNGRSLEVLGGLKGKKILVVDEMISNGIGLCALNEFGKALGLDISYYALSVDPDKDQKDDWNKRGFRLSYQEQINLSSDLLSRPNYSSSNIVISESMLFTRAGARYLVEDGGTMLTTKINYKSRIIPEFSSIYKLPTGELPHPNNFNDLDESDTWEEHAGKAQILARNTYKKLSDLILDTIYEIN